MAKSLHRHCTFKTVLERKRRSGFSAEMPRLEEKAQKRRAVADGSKRKQRRPGRLDRRRWRVEFGGQSVLKTRPSAVAVEPRDQLVVDEVRRCQPMQAFVYEDGTASLKSIRFRTFSQELTRGGAPIGAGGS